MKKLISIFLTFALISCASIPLPFGSVSARADSDVIQSGDWGYRELYKYNGVRYGEICAFYGDTSKKTVVPARINNVKIIGIASFSEGGSQAQMPYDVTVSSGIQYLRSGYSGLEHPISITLPSTLKCLGGGSFEDCTIEKINFPQGLECIEEWAFQGVTFSDTDITLPESLKYLAYCAFEKTNITSVSIGSKTRIENYYYDAPIGFYYDETQVYKESPFAGCRDLNTIILNKRNPYLKYQNGGLYDINMKRLYAVDNSLNRIVIPDTVTFICNQCFSKRKLNSVVIGKSVKKISVEAFYEADIAELTFNEPSQCESIEWLAFMHADIGSLYLPASLEKICDNAFGYATLGELNVAQGSRLTAIGEKAFYHSEIESMDLSSCSLLSEVGSYAFSFIDNLAYLDVRNTLLNELNIYFCPALAEIHQSFYTTAYEINSVTQYKPSADRYYYDLDNRQVDYNSAPLLNNGEYDYYEIGDYISIKKYTGSSADVTVPDTINGKPVRYILDYAFERCVIDSLELPDTLIYVGRNLFKLAAPSLSSLTVTDSVKVIARSAFSGINCDAVELGNGVEYVFKDAFSDVTCGEITLPDSVKFVDADAFSDSVKTLNIGSGLMNIHSLFKWNKPQFEAFNISEDNPYYSSHNGVVYTKDMRELIRYPENKPEEEYSIPDGVVSIAEEAFQNNRFLKVLNIPSSVEEISNGAFRDAVTRQINALYPEKPKNTVYALEEVHFGNCNIDSIAYMFSYVSTLKKVTFGKNAKIRIMKYAFLQTSIEEIELPECEEIEGILSEVPSLKKVTFREGVEFIGWKAFYGSSVKKLVLPESAVYIDVYAFAKNSELKSVDLSNVKWVDMLAFCDDTALERIDLTGVRYDSSSYGNSFKNCTNLRAYSYTRYNSAFIPAEANLNNETMESVEIGGGIEEIKEGAFAGCTHLATAMIAETVTEIDDTAFADCENLTIICVEDSVAHQYALKNNISVVTLRIAAIPDQTYTGAAITPPLTVTVGSKTLSVGEDYSAQYTNNVNPGVARVTVTGRGDYAIYGATAKFTIVAPSTPTVTQQEEPRTEQITKPAQQPSAAASAVQPAARTESEAQTAAATATALSRPKQKAIKRVKGGVKLSWKAVSGAKGYEIQYSRSKQFKNAEAVRVSAKKTALTLKKLPSGKRYYFRIRAVNGSSRSAWSNKKSVKS